MMLVHLARFLGSCAMVGACGRIGFDPSGGGDASGDGMTGDSGTGDGQPMVVSCVGLPATCGATGTLSCCASPVVPAGTFYRGYDGGLYSDMTNPATVSAFRLDAYEVTVARFRQFIGAGQGTQASPPPAGVGARTLNGAAAQAGWDPSWDASLTTDTAALAAALKCDATYQAWTDTPGANESLPINCITWFEAMAFCTWDGGYLPSDAEWNYAASGGAEQRKLPWSSPPSSGVIDCTYADYNNNGTTCLNPPNGALAQVGAESPTGDGKWGHADLAGNVYEWILDWDGGSYPNPCNDCADLTVASNRVTRGGSFNNPPTALLVAGRLSSAAGLRIFPAGVRCARPP